MSLPEHDDAELDLQWQISEGSRVIQRLEDSTHPYDSTAPTEAVNPLGYEVTLLSAVMLNIAQLMGSGIYSVPGSVLDSVGSIGLLLLYWILGAVFAAAGLSIYVEFASMFPKRSGAEVVYLEMSYPRPRFFIPTVFALSTVLLSFSATNAILFAQYSLVVLGWEVTSSRQTVFAIGVTTFAALAVILSTKWSLRIVTFLTSMKVISAIFMVMTGAAVLCGLTRVPKPYANFENIFEGSTTSVNALAIAFVKINYSYIGWANSFNVLGEVRGPNPVRTVRRAGYISLGICAALFFFINVAYVSAVPREDMRNSGQLIAAIFFQRVFGDSWGAKLLPLMVSLSCLSNIIAVSAGQARVLREVARQGILPYPSFFVSTEPFGTPIGPIAFKYALTALVILAIPGKDAFNFMVDLNSYPNLTFNCAVVIGLLLLRKRRALDGIAQTVYRAGPHSILIFFSGAALLLIMPWVPPEDGKGDVSFWYATYCVSGVALLALASFYYYVWIIWLPKFWGYTLVEEIEELDDGARAVTLVKHYHAKEIGVNIGTEEESLLGIVEPSARN